MPHYFLCIVRSSIVLFTLAIFCVINLVVDRVWAESFPFVAESSNDRVNVRAGQSQNFEKLCQLIKGEEVIVLENDFGWYKIQLPSRVPVCVSDKYVRRLDDVYGEILADRVNVRAASNVEATIVGQLKKGSKVLISARKDGWYTIEPSSQVFGWVSQEFIKFKSADIASYKPRMVAPVVAQLSERNNDSHIAGTQAQATIQKVVSKPDKFLSVIGYLRVVASVPENKFFYELVVNEQPVYYVQGLKLMLNDFVHYMVRIDGTIIPGQVSSLSQPEISVSKIQLIF